MIPELLAQAFPGAFALFLALDARFFIVLPIFNLGHQTGLLAGLAKPLQRLLDWLDGLRPVPFTGVLYLLRWAVLVPLMVLVNAVAGAGSENEGVAEMLAEVDADELALQLLLAAPVFETAVECTGLYLLLRLLLRRRQDLSWKRPWFFVACAALAMVLLHPLQWQVILPTAITGSFLGYTYGHFATRSHLAAFAATALFHAGMAKRPSQY